MASYYKTVLSYILTNCYLIQLHCPRSHNNQTHPTHLALLDAQSAESARKIPSLSPSWLIQSCGSLIYFLLFLLQQTCKMGGLSNCQTTVISLPNYDITMRNKTLRTNSPTNIKCCTQDKSKSSHAKERFSSSTPSLLEIVMEKGHINRISEPYRHKRSSTAPTLVQKRE